ncbi:MAG: XdhC family protein [Acidimicrobiia bacterium]
MTDCLAAVARLIEAEEFGSRATVVAGPAIGQSAVIQDDGLIAGGLPPEIIADVVADAASLLDRERSLTLTYSSNEVYIESLTPRPHLVIFGAVHIAQELIPMARQLGFHVTVSDARSAFTTPERFPDADRLLVGWPDQIDLEFDRRTYVVVLSHDARFEDPLWPLVLPAPVAYIGAMGSSKTAARRRERLLADGFASEQIDRIHGPIGLRIGADTPAEMAIAILAEILESRARPGVPLELRGKVTAI